MVAPAPTGTPTTAFATTGTSITVTKPTGLQNGDLLAIVYRAQDSNATAVTVPSGFTRFGPALSLPNSSTRVHGMWVKEITDASGEPADYTVSLTGAASGRQVIGAFILRGGDAGSTAQTGAPSTYNGTGSGTTGTPKTAASYSVGTLPSLTIFHGGAEITSGNSHVPTVTPSGYTKLLDVATGSDTVGSRTYLWVGYRTTTTSPTDAANIGWSSSSGSHAEGASLVQKAVPAGETRAPTGGVLLSGRAHAVTPWRDGFPSVERLLRTYGATSAHRGGSAVWPEMSRLAYERSAMAKYGWLEFSAQRSSDGWWFGMHDNDFDRVSLVSGSPAPSTLTQAQIESTYQNKLNANGMPQSWYGMTDFLDDWVYTHVVMVDPKNSVGNREEFLDLLDSHGGPSKIIVKFSGVGGGAVSLANAATARGYQTWGYFYEADVADGDLATYQSAWSILGMTYNASEAAWNAVKAYGKPVIAHIVPDAAGYATAMSRGAWFAQVSGVASVPAVTDGVFADGSLALAGTAQRTPRYVRTAQGAVAVTGSAARQLRVTRVASAQTALSGSAVARTATVALGGLTIVGSATATVRYARTATAGVVITGSGAVNSAISRQGNGTIGLDGVAQAIVRYATTAIGILTISGGEATGPVTFPSVRTLTSSAPSRTLDGASLSRTLDGQSLDRTLIGAVP